MTMYASKPLPSDSALPSLVRRQRQIELLPNELIVQAWRVQSWTPGTYSIARFALADQGESTRLIFDHRAFPKGKAEHLASGWQEHYWDPLARFLAQ